MTDLHTYEGKKIRLKTVSGYTFVGVVDVVCDAADNYDEDDPESLNEDSICLNTDGDGGPLVFQHDILSIEILDK